MANIIKLSGESVDYLRKLCKRIAKANPNNSKTLDRASGIPDFAEKEGGVSPKQAHWICCNADYLKEPRPKELVGIAVSNDATMDEDPKRLIAKFKAFLRDGDAIVKSLERNLTA